jgi:hypothetical protein
MKLRKRFLFALAISIALHVVVISGPGWYLPTMDDLLFADEGPPLEARLVAQPRLAAEATVRPKPKPKKPRPAAAKPSPPSDTAKVSRGVTGGNPRGSTAPEIENPAPAPVAEAADTTKAEEAIPPVESPPAIVAPAPQHIALPKFVRIRYQVTMGENGFVVGSATQEIRHDDTTYSLRSAAETVGIAWVFRPAKIVNVSEGEIIAGALRPRDFRIERSNGNHESAHLDWQTGQAKLSNEKQFALEPGTQDMLSMFAQLALMTIDGNVVSLPVVTGKKVERYDFTVLGDEKIATPRGDRMALHLRNRQPDSKEGTDVWLGLDDARLPIKIRYLDRRGNLFDQVADRIELEETEGKR